MNNYKNSILKFSRKKHVLTYVHKLEFIGTGNNITSVIFVTSIGT